MLLLTCLVQEQSALIPIQAARWYLQSNSIQSTRSELEHVPWECAQALTRHRANFRHTLRRRPWSAENRRAKVERETRREDVWLRPRQTPGRVTPHSSLFPMRDLVPANLAFSSIRFYCSARTFTELRIRRYVKALLRHSSCSAISAVNQFSRDKIRNIPAKTSVDMESSWLCGSSIHLAWLGNSYTYLPRRRK